MILPLNYKVFHDFRNSCVIIFETLLGMPQNLPYRVRLRQQETDWMSFRRAVNWRYQPGRNFAALSHGRIRCPEEDRQADASARRPLRFLIEEQFRGSFFLSQTNRKADARADEAPTKAQSRSQLQQPPSSTHVFDFESNVACSAISNEVGSIFAGGEACTKDNGVFSFEDFSQGPHLCHKSDLSRVTFCELPFA